MRLSEIFEYSNYFLDEIIEEILKLKNFKASNPNNNEFEIKLKSIIGKSISDHEFDQLKGQNNENFKKELIKVFENSREQRIKHLGTDQSKELEKRIFLQSIDINWKSHIQYLEQLRQVIGLRSYGQRDPLIEYKKEAFNLFETLLSKLKYDFVTILINLRIVEAPNQKKEEIKSQKIDPKYIGKKMRRNEPCFCGSGKKYKHCCGSL